MDPGGQVWAAAWPVLIGAATGLLAVWVVLALVLWRSRPDSTRIGETIRVLPDVLRLLRRLAADPDLPRGVRVRLVLLLVYLAVPIDLIPDFVPRHRIRRRRDHHRHHASLGDSPRRSAGRGSALAGHP